MYFRFLLEVLKRALTAAPRVTDMLQILAASALPATSQFVGVQLPQNAGEKTLAYIGLVAVSFVIIRLFWAPYAIWKDNLTETAKLKLELSKPERMILEHLAQKRADFRIELTKQIYEMYNYGFQHSVDQKYKGHKLFNTASHLIHLSGVDADLIKALVVLQKASEFRFENKLDSKFNTDIQCLHSIYDYLNSRITIADLLRLWPPNTELKIPQ